RKAGCLVEKSEHLRDRRYRQTELLDQMVFPHRARHRHSDSHPIERAAEGTAANKELAALELGERASRLEAEPDLIGNALAVGDVRDVTKQTVGHLRGQLFGHVCNTLGGNEQADPALAATLGYVDDRRESLAGAALSGEALHLVDDEEIGLLES